MYKRMLMGAAMSLALLAAPAAQAQAPAANPLDNIPDNMPFNIPYGAPISLDKAREVMAAAVAETKKRNWFLAIAVVDSGGNLVTFDRMDGKLIGAIGGTGGTGSQDEVAAKAGAAVVK